MLNAPYPNAHAPGGPASPLGPAGPALPSTDIPGGPWGPVGPGGPAFPGRPSTPCEISRVIQFIMVCLVWPLVDKGGLRQPTRKVCEAFAWMTWWTRVCAIPVVCEARGPQDAEFSSACAVVRFRVSDSTFCSMSRVFGGSLKFTGAPRSAGPVGPISPRGPGGPGFPLSPRGPRSPLAPSRPSLPLTPSLPFIPGIPLTPFVPAIDAPGTPGGPCDPCNTWAPICWVAAGAAAPV